MTYEQGTHPDEAEYQHREREYMARIEKRARQSAREDGRSWISMSVTERQEYREREREADIDAAEAAADAAIDGPRYPRY